MKRETFEQQLRNRLDGYEPQVPDNLWEEIDARLSSDTPAQEKHKSYSDTPSSPTQKTKHPRVIPLWVKIAAAAACVAAVIFLVGKGSDNKEDNNLVAVDGQEVVGNEQDAKTNEHDAETDKQDAGIKEQENKPADAGMVPLCPPARLIAGSTPSPVPTVTGQQSTANDLEEQSVGNNEQEHGLVAQEGGDAGVSPTADHDPSANDEKPQNVPQKIDSQDSFVTPKDHHLTRRESSSLGGDLVLHRTKTSTAEVSGASSPSFSLYADNIFGRGGDTSAMYMSPALADAYTTAFENAPGSYRGAPQLYRLAGYGERSVHYRPVVFGFSAALPLGGRWAVQTGLTYNWLSSEFIHEMRGTTITDKQSLQYLGIPLTVSCQIWNKGAFSLYAAAGGAMLINTSARLKTDGVKSYLRHDRLQWSMSAVVGAEYELLPSWSLYIEPGVTYYPDNGSDIQNFYKDKPLNPSLQFGVRYRLSK